MSMTSKKAAFWATCACAAAMLAAEPAWAQGAQYNAPMGDKVTNMLQFRDAKYEMNTRIQNESLLRPEVSAPLMEAQKLIAGNDLAAAADKISKAERMDFKSAYERHVIARVKGMLAVAKRDPDEAARQYLVAAQGNWLKPEDRISATETVASLYYHSKNYKKAAEWFDRYADAGGVNANSGMLRAQSHYLVDDYASTAKVLDAELGRNQAAAKAPPPELMLKLLVDAKERINDVEGSRKAMQLLAQHYPGSKL